LDRREKQRGNIPSLLEQQSLPAKTENAETPLMPGGFLHGEPPNGFPCRRHNAYGLMNDNCGFLIFEVT
jgi:hypothetical protein